MILLTPGPISTSPRTKHAMLRDYGSRDRDFVALSERIRRRLLEIANAEKSHECVPLQGSGTFAVEAMLGTLVTASSKTLVMINGAYGERMAQMLKRAGRSSVIVRSAECEPLSKDGLYRALDADKSIEQIAFVHCETTAGVFNDAAQLIAIAKSFKDRCVRVMVDAISAFGALPLDLMNAQADAVAVSANKCLEGVPGAAFVLVEREWLKAREGNSPTVSLDLYDQWRALQTSGQWRFTPPTHVLLALDEALQQHAEEGGVVGRYQRYRQNCDVLTSGMRRLGFCTMVEDAHQAPIIVTFRMPTHPAFCFDTFAEALRVRGFVIYPGKLTREASFRIGCIGQVDAATMTTFLAAVEATLETMGCRGAMQLQADNAIAMFQVVDQWRFKLYEARRPKQKAGLIQARKA